MKTKKPYSPPTFEKRERLSGVTENTHTVTGGSTP